MQAVGFAHFLGQVDTVGKAILAILFVMSLASWYLIITKALTVILEQRRSAGFLEIFWTAPSIAPVESRLADRHPEEPFAHLAWHAVAARRKGNDEFVTRAMRRVIDEDT